MSDKDKKKNYTLPVREDLVNRLWYIRDLSNKKVNPNILINNFIEEMVVHYESKMKINKFDHKKSLKCNKCSSFMKVINYKGSEYWACTQYPKCKTMVKI
jgi:hypothetical protein